MEGPRVAILVRQCNVFKHETKKRICSYFSIGGSKEGIRDARPIGPIFYSTPCRFGGEILHWRPHVWGWRPRLGHPVYGSTCFDRFVFRTKVFGFWMRIGRPMCYQSQSLLRRNIFC